MPSPKITVASAESAFESLLHRKSAHTVRAYRTDIAVFAEWAKAESGAHALYDLLRAGRVEARKMVESFAQSIAGNSAQNTVSRRISALKSIVAEAFRDGLVDWKLEVVASRNLSPEQKKATEKRDMSGPTASAFSSILAKLKAELVDPKRAPAATRDLALIYLLENPMLRRSEAAALNVKDIDLTPGEEKVTILGKARTETEQLPLPRAIVPYLKNWLNLRKGQPSDPLFVRIRRSILTTARLGDTGIYLMTCKRGVQALGIGSKRLNPHALRHAGITILANHISERGIPVSEGMAVSRHKKADTFWKYVDRTGGRKREMVNAVASRAR